MTPTPDSPAARRPPSRTLVGDDVSGSESLPPPRSSSSESVSHAALPGRFFLKFSLLCFMPSLAAAEASVRQNAQARGLFRVHGAFT